MKLAIYYGGPKPLVAYGRNQCHLLQFAFNNRGWHTIGRDRATKQAVRGLTARGYLDVVGDQFRIKDNP